MQDRQWVAEPEQEAQGEVQSAQLVPVKYWEMEQAMQVLLAGTWL